MPVAHTDATRPDAGAVLQVEYESGTILPNQIDDRCFKSRDEAVFETQTVLDERLQADRGSDRRCTRLNAPTEAR